VRGRWIGHKLFAELSVEVDGNLTTAASHAIGEEVRHDLFHRLPRLADIIVHIDPVDITLDKEARRQQHHDTNSHHLDPTLNRTINTEQKI
jgi:divalent metal cation (Fe/Co/Zn/Cd) transporter